MKTNRETTNTRTKRRVVLIQPSHSWGRKEAGLPSVLTNLGARLMAAGMEVELVDLRVEGDPLRNGVWQHQPVLEKLWGADYIGITVIGPSYINVVVDLIREIRDVGMRHPILVGGTGVDRVSHDDFSRWFAGLGVVHQMSRSDDLRDREDSACIEECLGLAPGALPTRWEVSALPMLQKTPDTVLRHYLRYEFFPFIADGCIYKCAFCIARNGVPERYRAVHLVVEETRFCCEKARQFGYTELSAYVSSLDVLQNPRAFEVVLAAMRRVADVCGVTLDVRGLATIAFAEKSFRADPDLPQRLAANGFRAVSIGVDGSDPETWKRQNKGHNSLPKLWRVVDVLQEAGIKVAFFMVVGFPGTPLRVMLLDLWFSLYSALFFGVLIRPYMARTVTPSTTGGVWTVKNPVVRSIQREYRFLEEMEFAMIATPRTHPKWQERWMANFVYLAIFILLRPFGCCLTHPLFSTAGRFGWLAQFLNRRMPPDM